MNANTNNTDNGNGHGNDNGNRNGYVRTINATSESFIMNDASDDAATAVADDDMHIRRTWSTMFSTSTAGEDTIITTISADATSEEQEEADAYNNDISNNNNININIDDDDDGSYHVDIDIDNVANDNNADDHGDEEDFVAPSRVVYESALNHNVISATPRFHRGAEPPKDLLPPWHTWPTNTAPALQCLCHRSLLNLSYPQQSFIKQVFHRERCGLTLRRQWVSEAAIARRGPAFLAEREIQLPKDCNKVFASHWLSESKVIIGTKCNRLFVIDVDSGRKVEIPLMSKPEPPAKRRHHHHNRNHHHRLSVGATSDSAGAGVGRMVTSTSDERHSYGHSDAHGSEAVYFHRPYDINENEESSQESNLGTMEIDDFNGSRITAVLESVDLAIGLPHVYPLRDAVIRAAGRRPWNRYTTTDDRVGHVEASSNSSSSSSSDYGDDDHDDQDDDSGADDGDDTATAGSSLRTSQMCGIHRIVLNPSRTRLATGAQDPNEISIFSLPSFEPHALLTDGHTDWVFGIDWLDDCLLVSGSKDGSIACWHTDPPYADCSGALDIVTPQRKLLAKRKEHDGKVRDLRVNIPRSEFATISNDGTLKMWNPSRLTVSSTVSLPHPRDAVCLSVHEETWLYAVGSQSHTTFIDSRMDKPAFLMPRSVDAGWGVRSLSFLGPICSIGGGIGRISFFDLRALGYLNLQSIRCGAVDAIESMAGDVSSNNSLFLEAGTGHIFHDDIYVQNFQGSVVKHAIYTHSFDPAGRRLFASGGPLQVGASGHYCAVWE